MLHIADGVRAALIPFVVAAVVAVAVWCSWVHTPSGRTQWHGALLAIPVFGTLRRGAATARVAHSLAALLDSGVPIAAAMIHASHASGDAELAARLMDARARVTGGQSLSQALGETRAATDTTIRFVHAGEESGLSCIDALPCRKDRTEAR